MFISRHATKALPGPAKCGRSGQRGRDILEGLARLPSEQDSFEQPSDRPDAWIVGATNVGYTTGPLTDISTFWVSVSNSVGSVLSDTVTVTVVPAAPGLALIRSGSLPVLTLDGATSLTYRIEYSAELSVTVWTRLVELSLTTSPFAFSELLVVIAMRNHCPDCQRGLYNRRLAHCGLCGADIPESLRFTDEETAALDREMAPATSQCTRQTLPRRRRCMEVVLPCGGQARLWFWMFQYPAAMFVVGDQAGTATITVSRKRELGSTCVVDFDTRDGTATQGTDYVDQQGTLIFLPLELSKSFTIPVVPTSDSRARTVRLRLTNPSTGVRLAPSEGTLWILHPGGASFIKMLSARGDYGIWAATLPGGTLYVEGSTNLASTNWQVLGWIDTSGDSNGTGVASGGGEDLSGSPYRFYRAVLR